MRTHLASIAALVPALLAGGCFGRVDLIDPLAPARFDSLNELTGVMRDATVEATVWGAGKCTLARMTFGDGTTVEGHDIDFGEPGASLPWKVQHVYRGWPGPKTVVAEGITNCAGKATLATHVFLEGAGPGGLRENVTVAFGQPGATACNPLSGPTFPTLRPNTRVSIRTNPDPRAVIDFGCLFGGCVHNADGRPGSEAPPGFEFPGLRMYSLVLRVGSQVVQGGTDMSFITDQSGPLELCVNDDMLTDNTGAWGIDITVDESSAP